ncbi:hypothetical protein J6TS7_17660 [Paenibacillus dendritiformis]|uniref:AraC family ligand binding domain-containing protein n=1 Tax=Paenibacillus TaxID=44249 RepID=UPI001B23665D|nr:MULTISPECIES: AraC family ligand binding domain-containing protein [Paenibacillus]GIO78156.1 hypothetical protein J6TS7_17660 [Paenibacillus dendritiformis]
MANVTFYRDEALPFLEAKRCHKNNLAYQKHFHEEYSIGLIDEGETQAWYDGVLWRVETSFPPLMLHACQPAEDAQWKYKMLFIKPEWFAHLEMPDSCVSKSAAHQSCQEGIEKSAAYCRNCCGHRLL